MSVLRRSSVARNIAANLGGQLAVLGVGLLAARTVYAGLGQEALGIVLFAQTFNLVLASVLDFGFSSLTVREVAAHVERDAGYVRDLIRTASSVYWGTYAVTAAVLLLVTPWIATHWINLHTMAPATATTVMRMLGIAALTALPKALYVSVFRGLQRMAVNNAIDVATALLQQIGVVVIVTTGGGLSRVVFWLTATYAMQIAAYWIVLAGLISPRMLVPGWSTEVIRRNARFSAHMMSISWLAAVHTYVDKLIVSKLLAVGTFGWWSFASSIVARGALVPQAIGDAAYPSLSMFFAAGNRAAMLRQYRVLQDLVGYATLPIYAAITFFTLPLLTAVFNHQVANALLLPVAVLCLGYFMNGTLVMPYMYSLAVGMPQITSNLSFAAVFIVVPVTVIGVAGFGIAGASAGYLSYHLFFYAVAIPRYCRECLQQPASAWYRQAATVLLAGALTYGLGWIAAWAIGGLGTVALLLAFVAASLGFAALAVRLVDAGLRDRARHWLRSRAGLAAPEAA